MVEAVAARYEDELEAETAAGCAIAPLGDLQLLVAEGDLARAREALIPAGPPSLRPRRYRWLGWVLIAVMLAPLALSWLVSLYFAR